MTESWTRRTIADCLLREFPGEWGDAPRVGGNATVLRSTDIDDEGHVNLDGGARRSIPAKKLGSKGLAAGDILLESSGGGPGKPVGRVALFTGGGADAYLTSNFFRALRPDSRVAHAEFLRWKLQHFYKSPRIWLLQQQTTGIINLKYRDYLRSELDVPPLPEQRQIATILDTLDDAIRKTEQIIAKLKQVKQGLLHDLLTRGIDDNGELRDPERHPEQFKDSALGRIPREWEVVELGTVAEVFNGTTPSRARTEYWNGTIPWLLSGCVNDYRVRVPTEHVTERAMNETSLRLVPIGAVVVGLIGQGKTRGMSARLEVSATINQNLAAVVPGADANGTFIHLYLTHQYERLRGGGRGSNQDALNCSLVRKFSIVMPGALEQAEISRLVVEVEHRHAQEELALRKLRLLKAGLMEDLLTGRVRVTNLLPTERP